MDLPTLLGLVAASLFALLLECFVWLCPTGSVAPAGGKPERALLAFATVALCCHVTSWLWSSPLPGFVLGFCLLMVAIAIGFRRGNRLVSRFDAGSGWCLAYLIAIGLVFGPILLGRSEFFRLPNIFDLPKHIAAMASAEAGGWPGPNPYFPSKPFAYNLLFYQPWATLAHLVGGSERHFILVACSTLWTTWQMLGLLRRISGLSGLGPAGQLLCLFFATVAGGWVQWITPADTPLGANLKWIGKSTFWVDDPFISYIYVPQHVFAVAAILAAVVIAWDPDAIARRYFAVGVLLTAASLASFILAPLAVGTTGLLGLALAIKRRALPYGWVSGLGFVLATGIAIGPWLVVAKTWAGGDAPSSLSLLPLSSGWPWVWLSSGLVAPLSLVGAIVWLRKNSGFERVCVGVTAGGVAFLCLLHFPDSEIKATLFLRLICSPLAAAGLFAICQRWRSCCLSWGAVLLLPSFFIGVTGIAYFISTAYLARPELETALINKLRALPPGTRILMEDTDQEIAALADQKIFLDANFREDRYLPSAERSTVDVFFKDLKYQSPSAKSWALLDEMNYLLLNKSRVLREWEKVSSAPFFYSDDLALRRFDGRNHSEHRVVETVDLLPRRWQVYGPLDESRQSGSGQITLRAREPMDAGVVMTISLPAGLYEVELEVIGRIRPGFSGGAHFAIYGMEKLITVPPGEYPTVTKFDGHFECYDQMQDVNFALGFGGWAVGSGELTVTRLILRRNPIGTTP